MESLEGLVGELLQVEAWEDKSHVLFRHANVNNFFKKFPFLSILVEALDPEEKVALLSLVAIEQAEHILSPETFPHDGGEKLKAFSRKLVSIELFYKEMGGIVGYHTTLLSLLESRNTPTKDGKKRCFYPPQGIDIRKETSEVLRAISQGLEFLPIMAEIYPLGGAADRLRLYDKITGNSLPAAKLKFAGRTLLENLILDLEAREYLYYKIYGVQHFVPVAMMISSENEEHIRSICEENAWFGRPKELFFLFSQPLVPTISTNGKWCKTAPFEILMKPGGHGALWKVGREKGMFDWLARLGKTKALIRQINNPLAGVDYGLLAFFGIGCRENKLFGFASCDRRVKSSEGVNVLIENHVEGIVDYTLTNIEYCDFLRHGIEDGPKNKNSIYSKFPSNTNVLFADLQAVKKASIEHPMPGLLVNVKKAVFLAEDKTLHEEDVARLESTMQNIADRFSFQRKVSFAEETLDLPVFLTFNERRKTIGTTKKELTPGSSLVETPEGCFLEQMSNAQELLKEYCCFDIPEMHGGDLVVHPSCIFFYHPALGPLYRIIAQKIRGGSLSLGSELQLNIVNIDIEGLEVAGSLIIEATDPMGKKDASGLLSFALAGGRCMLKHVRVCNAGIDQEAQHVFWKREMIRKEACSIVLHGSAEFVAENVELHGNLTIEVEDGYRLTVKPQGNTLQWIKEKIDSPSWSWQYSMRPDGSIHLIKI